MKRSLTSLLVAGLFASTATASFAQNVYPNDKEAATDKVPSTSSSAMDAAVNGTGGTDTHAKQNTVNDKPQASTDGRADESMSGRREQGSLAFKKADTDNDGTLTKEEARAMPRLFKNFDAIDTNKDGTLSLDEVRAYFDAWHKASND